MRELCPNCYGIGTMQAENWHYADLNGRPIIGDVPCYDCLGRGVKDWHNAEAHKWSIERKQQMLRAAVDIGGSVYSQESRFFKVEEVRWGAITSVYFRPKAICDLLGMVFPGDLEDAEAAIEKASWDPSSGWRVTPKNDDGRLHMRCKAIELQLIQQIDIWSAFSPMYMPRDDRHITYITKLNCDLIHLQKGKIGRSWRSAVEAVKAQRAVAQAA